MTTNNLLVELFVEELPPKVLQFLGNAFANVLIQELSGPGLVDVGGTPKPYASPRRLAAHISSVRSQAPDMFVSQKLMPVSVALDASGEPTRALLKKLASVGADATVLPKLKRQMDGNAEVLYLESTVVGATLVDGLQKALDQAIARLPIPKVMQYQLSDGWTSVKFVRPAHGLVALHGDSVVPVQALGLTAGRTTHGHRFEARLEHIELAHADEYAERLEADGAVIASFDARRDEIARQLQAAAAKQGLTPIDDAALLDEVTALVERPNVLLCRFEAEFLSVPQECLILTMKANQKYFPLLDAAGALTNQFLVVSNITPADASRVIEGNERVVRPRLADAKFFFDQDRKRTLESRVAGLDKVVYHGKLGSLGARSVRVAAIARHIGAALGGDALAASAGQAAALAKADLVSDMVGEFPELQGTMGRYYAQHEGIAADVAWAIEDHYKPRFAGDALPRGAVGEVVALADKLETLVGMFGIGQLPTGDKDPFALRRHALGVIRLLVEKRLPLALNQLIEMAVPTFGDALTHDPRSELAAFVIDRLAVTLRDEGFSAQEVDAVLSMKPQHLADVRQRMDAVRAFAALPEAAPLAAANKRVTNILKKSTDPMVANVAAELLHEPAERDLAAALQQLGPQADAQFESGDYAASLKTLAALKAPVDAFFDTVMVNADDPALRTNRLGLLAQLHGAMNRVADLSKLAT
jgi:glycyl-tRNA synthetase beta chain